MNITDSSDVWNDLDFGDPELQKLLDGNKTNVVQEDPTCKGFDMQQGQTWTYPDNLPCRAYQQSITQAALFKNTLVVLPTGLGKTFIAAVVMYNIYRWYPEGKVIFLAPTRPLVAQQIDACKHIMPLPSKDTVELTGKLPRHKRFELWRTKRVFFATPQSVQSDIMGAGHDVINDFPFEQIKLLVIDEAHKAKGRFAYTEVTQAIWRRNRYFRVLALSATPGRTVDDVAEVVRNLFISHLEVRWDNSIDVMPYIHQRSIKTIVVPMGNDINKARAELIAIIDPYERQLIEAGVVSGSCHNISRNFLLFEQKRFRERSLQQSHPEQQAITSNFSICISLYHALELLERHGLRVFVNYFEQDEDGRTKFIYNLDPKLRNFIDKLRCELGPNPFDTSINAMTNGKLPEMPQDLDFGHPKFTEARQCLLQHFAAQPDSRAIVFCEYRESVLLVYRLLLQHVPVLRPRCFAGHSGTGALRALTQKQQIQIMQDFREGKSNILVATSIGEEGLDVGEVELIICFDISTSNPTRYIQRIGRTGRKKKGNVVMLVTEGREQRLLKEVMATKDQTNKKILRSPVVQAAMYKESPRLVPAHISPQCKKEFVQSLESRDLAESTTTMQNKGEKLVKTRKRAKKEDILTKGSQDLRKFFNNDNNTKKKAVVQKQQKNLDIIDLGAEDLDVFEIPVAGPNTQANMEKSFAERFGGLDLADISRKTNTQLLNMEVSQTRESKHLRKINKMLSSINPLVPTNKRKCDIGTVLKSKTLTQTSKLLLLKENRQFVKDICEKISILKAIEGSLDGNDLTKEEKEIHSAHQHLLSIFESESAVEQFIKEDKLTLEPTSFTSYDDFLYNEEDFRESLHDIFENLDHKLFTRDNFDYIDKKFKETDQYKRIMQRKVQDIDEGSMLEEVDTLMETDIDETTQLDLEHISEMNSKFNSYFEAREMQEESIILSDNEDFPVINTSLNEKLCAFEEFSKAAAITTNKSTPLIKRPIEQSIKKFEKVGDLLERLDKCLEEENEKEEPTHINVENSQISLVDLTSDNLTQLYVSVPSKENSTEKAEPPKPESLNFETELNVDLENRIEEVKPPKPESFDLETELNVDLDAFTEPFPEECFFTAKTTTSSVESPKFKMQNIIGNSEKENLMSSSSLTVTSPDLFEISESKPPTKTVVKPSLSSKLSQKCFNIPAIPTTPTKDSTDKRASTKNIKSPCIFESYWKKIEAHKMRKINWTRNSIKKPQNTHKASQSPVSSRKSHKVDIIPNSWDSDFEEIAPSQNDNNSSILRQRKRRRLCNFVQGEAEVSGVEHSSDEAEETIGRYMLDSVVVHDDEVAAEESLATRSHMEGLYLQSVRSPCQLPGAFKIPKYSTFNDRAEIFSQDIENTAPSQYIPDSFVVDEEEEMEEGNESVIELTEEEESMCPLEQAERLLRERRRARKLQAQKGNSPKAKRKRKVYCVSDSSDES